MADALRVLRAYPGLLRGAVAQTLAYRAQLVIAIIGGLFPLILLTVWLSVVGERGPAAGWTREDFISYYVGAAVVAYVVNTPIPWLWDRELRSGDLSFRLLRPVSPLHHFIANDIGNRIVTGAVLLPAFVLAALTLDEVRYPVAPATALLVVVAVLTGFALSVAMALAFAMIAFWSTQAANVHMLWWGAGSFMSGLIAPVSLLPEPVRSVAVLTPFRGIIDFPMQLALGRLDAAAALQGFAVSAVWLAGFVALQRLLWRRGIRHYQAVGG